MTPSPRQIIRLLWLAAGPLLAAAWIAGRIVRDHDGISLAFYLLPTPAVAVALAVWWLLMPRPRRRVPSLAVMAAFAAMVAHLFMCEMRWSAGTAAGGETLHVIHWNVGRFPLANGRIQSVLASDHPDICLLSETRTNPVLESAGSALGLPHVRFSQSMTLLSRWPVTEPEPLSLPEARGWCARVSTPQGPLDVLAIDVVSKPQLDRRPALTALSNWVAARDRACPLLVLGDFNTPADSRAFIPLRALLAHAYETNGRGWPFSWPVPFPLYALDHAWYSRETVECKGYVLKTADISDHRRQVLSLLLHPGGRRT